MFSYKKFIESRFTIINKQGQEVPFTVNPIQERYLTIDMTGKDIILKARQQGFSSIILAMFTADFILKENSRSVVVADIDDNSSELLDRVKRYIASYEEITGTKVPLKYNSKTELYNESMHSRYTIGTAKNAEFGRSKTITNLHLSEAAFYPNLERLIAGAGQAVVEGGRFIVETTANGFNEFKTLWDDSQRGETGFTGLFYKASDFYSPEFLEMKKKQLKRLYKQEYPETPQEAFLTSGESYFDVLALEHHYMNIREKLREGVIYV